MQTILYLRRRFFSRVENRFFKVHIIFKVYINRFFLDLTNKIFDSCIKILWISFGYECTYSIDIFYNFKAFLSIVLIIFLLAL